MAINTEIILKNLAPGKRYRMVVESSSNPDLVAPSIEFNVPASPRLISEYTPRVSLDNSRSTSGITVGTNTIAAQDVSRSVTDWSRTTGSYNYTFWCNSTAGLSNGMVVRLDGISSGTHEYYDRLKYTVYEVGAGYFRATASYDPNFQTFCHDNHYPSKVSKKAGYSSVERWEYIDGRAMSTGTNGNVATAYYTIPGSSTRTETPWSNPVTDVTVTLPDELIKNPEYLVGNQTVRYLPIFFYNTAANLTGSYKNLDGTNLSLTPLSYNTSTMPKNMPVSASQLSIPDRTGFKDYRFSIIRYVLTGSTWVGSWAQTTTGDTPSNFSQVIISKQGIVG